MRLTLVPISLSYGSVSKAVHQRVWIGSVANFVKRVGEFDLTKMMPEEAAELQELVSKMRDGIERAHTASV